MSSAPAHTPRHAHSGHANYMELVVGGLLLYLFVFAFKKIKHELGKDRGNETLRAFGRDCCE